MFGRVRELLDRKSLRRVMEKARQHVDAGQPEEAWRSLSAIRQRASDAVVAEALISMVDDAALLHEHAVEAASLVFAAHGNDPKLLSALGNQLERICDIDHLNAAAPEEPIFGDVARRLDELSREASSDHELEPLLRGLGTASKAAGRRWDQVCERAHAQLVDLDPSNPSHHYNLGLFYKTRGRFSDGLDANLRAAELGNDEDEATLWNTGICATGAGEGATALRIWKSLGQRIEMGRFGLPDGSYPDAKVRLAQRPLATRDTESMPDEPGLEETIWVERLSPCHGIVRSALYQDIGTDYGDVVLFDGAPITHQTYGDQDIPVFPHLVTLERGNYGVYPFAGTQKHERQLADLSERLPEDAVVYVHTEQVAFFCAQCWSTPGLAHDHETNTEHRVVYGKICAPPSIDPARLLAHLDEVVEESDELRILAPELAHAAGLSERSEVESRRMAMLEP